MKSPVKVGLLQAAGLAIYIALVGTFMFNANHWFGNIGNFLGPITVLTLFSVSVLICGFIALGYPIKLFWIKKQPQVAIKIVAYTTGFLFIFLILLFTFLLTKP